MADIFESECIVLRKTRLLQKDVRIVLLTKEKGKISAIAKGTRTITSRRAGHLQTGNLIRISCQMRSVIHYIQTTSLISAFSQNKSEREKINLVYLGLFLIDRLVPEEDPHDDIYTLTKSYLISVSRSTAMNNELLQLYLHDILQSLGYVDTSLGFNEEIRLAEEIINEKIPISII